jgi:hypothetical protein
MWKDENFSKVVARVLLVLEALTISLVESVSWMRRMPRADFGTS